MDIDNSEMKYFNTFMFFMFLSMSNGFVHAQNDITSPKILAVSKVIDCNLSDTWQKWTTNDGLCTFLADDAIVELKIHGKFEIHRQSNQFHSTNCKVLSFLPNEMLSFTWKMPSEFEQYFAELPSLWVVVYFDAVNDDMTRINIRLSGFEDSKFWRDYYMYAQKEWTEVLSLLGTNCAN